MSTLAYTLTLDDSDFASKIARDAAGVERFTGSAAVATVGVSNLSARMGGLKTATSLLSSGAMLFGGEKLTAAVLSVNMLTNSVKLLKAETAAVGGSFASALATTIPIVAGVAIIATWATSRFQSWRMEINSTKEAMGSLGENAEYIFKRIQKLYDQGTLPKRDYQNAAILFNLAKNDVDNPDHMLATVKQLAAIAAPYQPPSEKQTDVLKTIDKLTRDTATAGITDPKKRAMAELDNQIQDLIESYAELEKQAGKAKEYINDPTPAINAFADRRRAEIENQFALKPDAAPRYTVPSTAIEKMGFQFGRGGPGQINTSNEVVPHVRQTAANTSQLITLTNQLINAINNIQINPLNV